MLNGLTREVRWREVTEEKPAKMGYVLVARALIPPLYGDGEPDGGACSAAYWSGTDFRVPDTGRPLSAVTHWMPYPALPSEDAMRRVFRELLGTNGEESPC